MRKFLLSMLMTMVSLTSFASHLLGGYMQIYQHGFSDTVDVYVVLFSDPQGISSPQTITLNEYKLSNGFYQTNGNLSITKTATGYWQGVNVDTYLTTTTLSSGDYRFIYTNCCRGMLTNASSSMNSNFTIGLDYKKTSQGSVPNSSPFLLNFLPSNWSVGNPSQILLYSFDPDGDSISVEMDDALNQYANGTFVPVAPFNQLSNYGTYNVLPNGLIQWGPTTQGVYGTGYKVSEYRNGQLIGVNRIQQVYHVVNGSTPNIVSPFNMTFNNDSTVTINHDLLDGDSTYVGFTSSNAVGCKMLIYGVATTQAGTSTWTLPNLQIGTYEGVLRVYNNDYCIDYPLTLNVTSTIGIVESELPTVYEVFDWMGNQIYKGEEIPYTYMKGFYVVRYNGKTEKIYVTK